MLTRINSEGNGFVISCNNLRFKLTNQQLYFASVFRLDSKKNEKNIDVLAEKKSGKMDVCAYFVCKLP